MKYYVSLLLLLLATLAGCGTSADLPITNNLSENTGTVLSGGVIDGRFDGAVVRAYHVQPSGTIGEPQESVLSYPVPAPEPVAVSEPLDADGKFNLRLPDNRPVLLWVTNDSAETLQAAVGDPQDGPVLVSPLTLMSTRLALSKVRSGAEVESAFVQADQDLAGEFALESVLRPTSLSDQVDYVVLLDAFAQLTDQTSVELNTFLEALSRDLVDGKFDGKEGEVPLNVAASLNLPSILSELFQLLNQQNGTNNTETVQQVQASLGQPPQAPANTEPSAELKTSLHNSDGVVGTPPGPYQSPYSVTFTCTPEELTGDFDQFPRSEIAEESFRPPFREWYDQSAYPDSQLPWGPWARTYPEPTAPPNCDPVIWQRERVLASALKRIGTNYQHHHIPDWNPTGWPKWLPVSLGHNGPGIDCSNFSSWNYNFGLGLKLETSVSGQASSTTFELPNNQTGQIEVVTQVSTSEPANYEELLNTLKTGDLLYIRARSKGTPGEGISHVIMWVGDVGNSPDNIPLIIDSHDNKPPVSDSNDVVIPAGVHLRPFRQGSWYHTAFDHAHRIVR